MSALVAMGIKEELDIPFIVTFHALGHVRRLHQAENDKFPVERLAIEEAAVKQADHIIAECPQDKEDLIKLYGAHSEKISIIPCGFSAAEFYPINKTEARRETGLPENETILLQLGRMVPRKGIDNVIRALANLKGNKTYKLVIVGGNNELEKCTEYKRLMHIATELNIRDQVIFTGRKDRDQLKFYYAAADVFITTPWYEPFGITPLEAMACGTPVIGSRVGGIKYSVVEGVTGALVPPDDPRLLAKKIEHLISDQAFLKQLGKNAIKHVNTHFTWKKVAEQVDALYRYVAALQDRDKVNNNIKQLEQKNKAA
jgi:glycosyltransferase involved in cell wall biosynthesis